MENDDKLKTSGIVTEALRGSKFKVRVNALAAVLGNPTIVATLAGKLRINNIKILVGDRVDVEIPLQDITKGRIIWRYRK